MLYDAILERWEGVPDTNWWEFSQMLCDSDLAYYAEYFTAFTEDRVDLHEKLDDSTAEQYRKDVLEDFVEWFSYHVQQHEGVAAQHTPPSYAADTEQSEQVDDSHAAVAAEKALSIDGHGILSLAAALEAFSSDVEEAGVLTDDHLGILGSHSFDIEVDLDALPSDSHAA